MESISAILDKDFDLQDYLCNDSVVEIDRLTLDEIWEKLQGACIEDQFLAGDTSIYLGCLLAGQVNRVFNYKRSGSRHAGASFVTG